MTGRTDTAQSPAPQPEPHSASSNTAKAVEEFAEHLVEGVAHFVGKPRARGWIHVYAAGGAAGAGLVAVSWSVETGRASLATLAYPLATVAMFAVSATYHRVRWQSETAEK